MITVVVVVVVVFFFLSNFVGFVHYHVYVFFLPSSSKVSVVFCLISFPIQSVVRASDVRVSNRVNKASVTLNKYPTVYNDLTGEVRYHKPH